VPSLWYLLCSCKNTSKTRKLLEKFILKKMVTILLSYCDEDQLNVT
jgi:hypothetical protein